MTFDQYWNRERSAIALAIPPENPAMLESARDSAMGAWDAAVCAAQAALFDQGKPRDHAAICRRLSSLHTWAQPLTEP